jgi:hypothetical protein
MTSGNPLDRVVCDLLSIKTNLALNQGTYPAACVISIQGTREQEDLIPHVCQTVSSSVPARLSHDLIPSREHFEVSVGLVTQYKISWKAGLFERTERSSRWYSRHTSDRC